MEGRYKARQGRPTRGRRVPRGRLGGRLERRLERSAFLGLATLVRGRAWQGDPRLV